TSAASAKPMHANTWPGLRRSTGMDASATDTSTLVVLPRRALIGGAKQGFPPSEPPGTPPLLQSREAQRDRACALDKRARWRVLTALGTQHRPREAMVCGDQVQHEIAVFGPEGGN